MKIILDKERPLSWNLFYSGRHWSKRNAEAARVHQLVKSQIKRPYKLFTKPVIITVPAFFKGRQLDADNICAKLYIDSLKGTVIVGDSPKYVEWVKTESKVDKKRPRIEINVIEAN